MALVNPMPQQGTTAPAVRRWSADWGVAQNNSIDDLLRLRAETDPNWELLRWRGGAMTISELDRRVDTLACGLSSLGVKFDTPVVLMMGNHVDHIVSIFALARLGAVNVPINPSHKGGSLTYLMQDSQARFCICDAECLAQIEKALGSNMDSVTRIVRGQPDAAKTVHFANVAAGSSTLSSQCAVAAEDCAVLLYTSGTTGMPKGVPMSDSMIRAAAIGCLELSGVERGSVLHFWDPLYHVFGLESLLLALIEPAHLVLVPRFSASRFWEECAEFGVTHIHFVGSILPILLKQPPGPRDRAHSVRIAWGGGCPSSIWEEFETRFGLHIREGYGLTETSSFCLINTDQVRGSVGRALAYFNVAVVDENGTPVPAGQHGQIAVRARRDGVLFTRYLNRPEATEEALQDGWFRTGDIAYCDADGNFYFIGRLKNMIRRRGENISAAAVEDVVGRHPLIEECALIPVPSEVGEDDLKLFIRLSGPDILEPKTFWSWCAEVLPTHMLPDYAVIVEEFEKTPTQRIRKELLPKTTPECWIKPK